MFIYANHNLYKCSVDILAKYWGCHTLSTEEHKKHSEASEKHKEDKKVDSDEEEITIDFKKIFKGKSKKHKEQKPEHKVETKSEDEEVSVDLKGVTSFFKKSGLILLILIPIFLSIFLRAQPIYLSGFEDRVRDQLYNNLISSYESEIESQYPFLPAAEKRAEALKKFEQVKAEQGDAIEQAIKDQANSLRSFYQDENGNTYLLAIDPYLWYKHALNYVNNGHIGEIEIDGKSYDILKKGRWQVEQEGNFHPLFESWIYRIMSIFNKDYTVMQAAFLSPLLICTLGVIPLFFLGRKIAGNVGGFISATLAAVHPALMTRTTAGFADTDAYHFLLPVTAIWLFLEAYTSKDLKKKIALFAGSGFIIALHNSLWSGWWYNFVFLLTAAGAMLVIQLIKNRKHIKKSLSSITTPLSGLITIFLSTAIFSSLIFLVSGRKFSEGFTSVVGALGKPLWFINLKAVAEVNLWPNVLTTVAELNPSSISGVMNSMGGLLFFVAIGGVVALFTVAILKLVKKDKLWSFYMVSAILLAVWFVSGTYAAIKSIRFSAILVPGFALAIGVLIGTIYEPLRRWTKKELDMPSWVMTSLIVIIIFFIVLFPTVRGYQVAVSETPSMNDGWYSSLITIKEDSTVDNAIITSWWDFGHWFKAIAERPVTFDGGDQGKRIHWVGKSLLTNSEEESAAILRMLNCDQNNASVKLESFTANDTVKSIEILNQLILLDEDEAAQLLSDEGFTSQQTSSIIESTHCEPWENYYIVSSDMIGKSGVWAHFGSWNFTKAEMHNQVRKLKVGEGIQLLKDRYGLDENTANKVYFDIKNTNADQWISPWPSYISGGWKSCSQTQEGYDCRLSIGLGRQGVNNLVLDSVSIINESATFNLVTQNSDTGAVVGGSSLRPAGFAKIGFNGVSAENGTMFFEEGILKEEYNDSGIPYDVLFDMENERVLVSDPALTESVFTHLYFFEGRFSKYFQLFHKARGIYIYKVKWDGTAYNEVLKNEIKARHILINLDNRTEEEALSLINEIRENATEENFAELATEYSEGPSSVRGGDLGWFGKGMMVAPFEQAAFNLEVGEISQPVKTQFGYHLILVEGKR